MLEAIALNFNMRESQEKLLETENLEKIFTALYLQARILTYTYINIYKLLRPTSENK